MKLRQLIESREALGALLKNPLPISIGWTLKQFLVKVNPELTAYEELRTKTVIEMGEPIVKDGKPTDAYSVKPENLKEYTKVINELLEKEIDVIIPVIKINELMEYKNIAGKGIEILTGDLLILDWLIKE